MEELGINETYIHINLLGICIHMHGVCSGSTPGGQRKYGAKRSSQQCARSDSDRAQSNNGSERSAAGEYAATTFDRAIPATDLCGEAAD